MTPPSTFPSGLYFVATPIGAARDITLRALDILRDAEVIAAEDTRVARKLMEIHAVALGERRIIAYHDHNGAAAKPKLLAALKDGARVAYVSDAGTPLIADPGFDLARAAIEEGYAVFSAPGASAVLAALTVSGLPTDQFFFAGFLPPKEAARKRKLEACAAIGATVVFYEAPHRVKKCLSSVREVFGGEHSAVICRELTKKFESVYRGSVDTLIAEDIPAKGEFVILLAPAEKAQARVVDIEAEIKRLLKTQSVKETAAELAKTFGKPRKEIYQMALALKDAD